MSRELTIKIFHAHLVARPSGSSFRALMKQKSIMMRKLV